MSQLDIIFIGKEKSLPKVLNYKFEIYQPTGYVRICNQLYSILIHLIISSNNYNYKYIQYYYYLYL